MSGVWVCAGSGEVVGVQGVAQRGAGNEGRDTSKWFGSVGRWDLWLSYRSATSQAGSGQMRHMMQQTQGSRPASGWMAGWVGRLDGWMAVQLAGWHCYSRAIHAVIILEAQGGAGGGGAGLHAGRAAVAGLALGAAWALHHGASQAEGAAARVGV